MADDRQQAKVRLQLAKSSLLELLREERRLEVVRQAALAHVDTAITMLEQAEGTSGH